METVSVPGGMPGPALRAFALLRLLASAGRRGAALTALATSSGLPNSTVHRLLAQLVQARLAMQIEGARTYAIGPLAYELGLAAAQQFDIRGLCRPVMERLAGEAGETVYLVQRSGDEAVCIDMVEGPTPVRVVTLQIGSRRPVGLGAGGLAILAALPEDEARRVFAQVREPIARDGQFGPEELWEGVLRARAEGHSTIANRITPGVTAIGRAFADSLGHVFGAVSVAAVNARMGPQRLAALRPVLARAAADIEQALRSQRWARLTYVER
jgi:DNA-binding IclR family transcriptional regulator